MLKISIYTLLNLLLISRGNSDTVTSEAKLLFKSGFEDGVYLDLPYNDGGGCWFQDIKGDDIKSFEFLTDLWSTKATFQILVDSEKNPDNYIKNEIITIIEHNKKYTKVMSSEVIKADESWTQDPYILINAKENGDLYVSYWLKLPKNLPEVPRDGTDDDG